MVRLLVCFSSLLSDGPYYGRDHQVNGTALFAGAGFLEIACVAATMAGESAVTGLEDIVWVQPLPLARDQRPVHTFLKPNGTRADCVIASFGADNERVVHAECRVLYGSKATRRQEAARSIDALKARASKTLPGTACYRQFDSYGFRYGPSFQTLQELHVGSDFALSRLALAEEQKGDFEQYMLHPCLIDGALQTVVGFAAGAEPDTPYLPFALGRVEISRPLARSCYALVERGAPAAAGSDVLRFDIRLLSESGELLVTLKDFSVRALRGSPRVRLPRAEGTEITATP